MRMLRMSNFSPNMESNKEPQFLTSYGLARSTTCASVWLPQVRGQSTYKTAYTSPAHKPDNTSPTEKLLFFSRRERCYGSLTTVEWFWPLSTGWDLYYFPWLSKPVLAIWNEGFPKGPYRKKQIYRLQVRAFDQLSYRDLHIWAEVIEPGTHFTQSAWVASEISKCQGLRI